MFDFLSITHRQSRKGCVEVVPKFIVGNESTDLMIRGGDFYAVWLEDKKRWSTNENDIIRYVDMELKKYGAEHQDEFAGLSVTYQYMWDSESGSIDKWHKYCQRQQRDHYRMLDETLVFSNSEMRKEDYASKMLSYPLEDGSYDAWDHIIGTLYSPIERHKIEWAIGSIVSGDSKKLQKFMVFYGAAGTGKSTILNIVQKLFDGYYSTFDAKALGSNGESFALEAFSSNPLVAIQHDGDLSRIEDNTRLNSLVSHEEMRVNEKYAKTYTNSFKAFLFMGTNKPVKITDGKSGLLRRLIDVTPSGNKLSAKEYKRLTKQVNFELGAIAKHCLDVYLEDPNYYDAYVPLSMMGASNDFYNYVLDNYHIFLRDNGTSLKAAWEMYKAYCEDANVPHPFSQRVFKEELKNYFWDFDDKLGDFNNTRVRNRYFGFRTDKFENEFEKKPGKENPKSESTIIFKEQHSLLDDMLKDCPAQLANAEGTPKKAWTNVKTTLEAIDTKKLHYVRVPENHIVIDFDIKGEDGSKSFEKNLAEASKWPATYAELSKSGSGIHLHYIYNGDVSKLDPLYDKDIEVKVFTGKSSLRRLLSKCNDVAVATISSGLPLRKEAKKMLSSDAVKTEKGLRTTITKCIAKGVHSSTKCNIDFIYKILEDAYNDGMKYDVTDMRNDIYAFAQQSNNNAEYCIKLVNQMKFKSEDPSDSVDSDAPLVFYDIEVFPNLFLVNWKIQGEGKPVVRMINPTPQEIEELIKFRLVGFNCRRYDNHIMYARLMGLSNEDLYDLSKKIVSGQSRNCFYSEAYNLSYTDVYDFASAGNKKSLKKLEIEMGIHHQELGLPWDQPVDESLWEKVAEYCDNDVIATEAAFNYLSEDWTARQILAELAGGTVNDTTNSLTTKFIFGNNRKPQNEFCYRNLAEPCYHIDDEVADFLNEACPDMMGQTFGEAGSLLPYFPGYKFENGVSTYRGEEVGEGGYVYAEPGMYGNVALLDIASMHPHSTIAECLFGPRYTRAYRDVVEGRVSIKHEAWDVVNTMLDGKLTPFIQKVINGEMTSKGLANALKTAINSVYGLTSATFENPFRDSRNIDNIVAKRGALFMIDLKHEVQKRGFTVAHIKTDSIKIPDATPEIIEFVMEFGKKYGYTFEHEATYERMCLVNNAVYIAKYDNGEWTATGKQFAVPYVYKTLFTHEDIVFDDLCETFAVQKGDLNLDMNENLPDVSEYEKELEKLETKYKKGQISDLIFENEAKSLNEKIEPGHEYRFVGRVGQFCPMAPGSNGGVLYRFSDGKKYAAPGSTGYRWLESEDVKILDKQDKIDMRFYEALADDAIETISKFGDFEWFVSDRPYIPKEKVPDWMKIPQGVEDETIPFA